MGRFIGSETIHSPHSPPSDFHIIFSAGLYMVFDKTSIRLSIRLSIRFNIENDIKTSHGGVRVRTAVAKISDKIFD